MSKYGDDVVFGHTQEPLAIIFETLAAKAIGERIYLQVLEKDAISHAC